MRGLFGGLILLAVALGGCTESSVTCQKRDEVLAYGYYVPSTAIMNSRYFVAAGHPEQILPSSDGEYFIPRGERQAVGVTALAESTYYSIYTYDSQAISVPGTGGYGYQYRWIQRQGLAVPAQ